MKKQFRKDCIIGGIAGIVIYFIETIASTLSYLPGKYLTALSFSLVILGLVISVFALLYKRPRITSMLIRFVVLLISYGLILVVIGSLGLLPRIYRFLNITTSSGADAASGMMTMFFLLAVVSSCIITIAIVSVIKRLLYLKKNR